MSKKSRTLKVGYWNNKIENGRAEIFSLGNVGVSKE